MYDVMRNDLITELGKTILDVDLERHILSVIDRVCNKYTISKKETGLISYTFEYPKEINAYICCKRIEGVSQAYLNNVRYCIQNLVMCYQKPISQITTNDIRVFLDKYKDLKNISLRSLDKYRQNLNSFFDWCNQEGYIDTNPMSKIKKIKYGKRKRKSLDATQLEYLFDACQNLQETALIAILFSSACRGQEIANMTIDNIDWSKNEFSVIGKGNKQRVCYITGRAEVAVKKYLESKSKESNYVFSHNGKGYNVATLRSIFNKVYARVQNKIPFKVTPHIIRHTTATLLLRAGMPIEQVSKYLGHAQISTTQIYTDIEEMEIKTSFMKALN